MNSILADLLPYDLSKRVDGNLRTSLQEYRALLVVLKDATRALLHGDLEKFDALVGENACEIRAVKIASIASKSLDHIATLGSEVEKIIQSVDRILTSDEIIKLMKKRESLLDVLRKNNLHVFLTPDESFAIDAFLLTELQDVRAHKEIIESLIEDSYAAPSKIRKYSNMVSNKFGKKLLAAARSRLSRASVNFTRAVAAESNDCALSFRLSEEFTKTHNGCQCTPAYWTFKAMLEKAKNDGIGLVLHAKFLKKEKQLYRVYEESRLYFAPVRENQRSFYREVADGALVKTAWVIEGLVCESETEPLLSKKEWEKVITDTTVERVILAAAAAHRQYPDTDAADLFSDDQEYLKDKALANKNGFSIENPSRFLVLHAYPNMSLQGKR